MVICRAKKAQFNIHAPGAKRVSLAGNFNNWDTKALQAKKDSKGNWMVKVNLEPGRYEYKFFIDGSWMSDPSCKTFTTNIFGTQNCIREVK